MSNTSTEILNEKTGELVPYNNQEKSLVFGTVNPESIIDRATLVSKRLADIVKQAKLSVNISGRDYVKAEGWSAMIAMLGVFPASVWCNRLDRKNDEIAYEARVVLKHISGSTVGEGQGFASSLEGQGWSRKEFSVKSMAQTRAVGKACRLSFSWIMALAGYAATPFEEMEGVEANSLYRQIPASEIDAGEEVMSEKVAAKAPPDEIANLGGGLAPLSGSGEKLISEKQGKLLYAKRRAKNIPEDVWKEYLRDVQHVSSDRALPWSAMDACLKWIDFYPAG